VIKVPLTTLQKYIGRRAVYIEARMICVVVVESVEVTETHLRAIVRHDSENPLVCDYYLYNRTAENSSEAWSNESPFGERWQIEKAWEWFYYGKNDWDGSLYMGFHLLFAPKTVEKFLSRDLSWIERWG
jgi:hypothetical protein